MKKSEDPKKFIDLLNKSIIEVVKNDGVIIPKECLVLKNYHNKYSNLKTTSLTLFNNNIPLKRDLHKVTYKCLCGNVSNIHLKKFLSKGTFLCPKCKETEDKGKKHSELLRSDNFTKKIKPNNEYLLATHIDKSILQFKNESGDFVKNYYEKNITECEFDKIKNKITSINGVDVVNTKIKFLPVLSIGNQTKYSQFVIVDGEKVSFKKIKYKCDNCDDIFNTTRKAKNKVQNHKILCPKCSFCNNIFKLRRYETKFGDVITYQSKLEKYFIEQCELKDIKILDGITVDYVFNETKHKYRIDFLLPEFNKLVEIKANHIWHRNQLESGIWKIKQTKAEKHSIKNNLNYILLFNEDIDVFLTSIKI